LQRLERGWIGSGDDVTVHEDRPAERWFA
jgi:hypothetical protein